MAQSPEPELNKWRKAWLGVRADWRQLLLAELLRTIVGWVLGLIAGIFLALLALAKAGFLRNLQLAWLAVATIGIALSIVSVVGLIRATAPRAVASPAPPRDLPTEAKLAIKDEVDKAFRSFHVPADQHAVLANAIWLACMSPGSYKFDYKRLGGGRLQLSKDIAASVVTANDDELDRIIATHEELLRRIEGWAIWHTLNPGPVVP